MFRVYFDVMAKHVEEGILNEGCDSEIGALVNTDSDDGQMRKMQGSIACIQIKFFLPLLVNVHDCGSELLDFHYFRPRIMIVGQNC
jgi:hypothetical protein